MATLSDIRDTVQDDLDLQDEDFIDDAEVNRHIRRGVKNAQKIVLGLNEDYFLKKASLSLVSGTQEYALPTGIYAHKIRKVIYVSGSRRYVVHRMKHLEDTAQDYTSAQEYQYLMTMDTTGTRMALYPTPSESGAFVTIWYLRTAADLLVDTDVLDIPEAYDYVVQYAKDACLNKERGSTDAPPSQALLNEQSLLEGDLMNRVPDEDNELEPDMSHYEEHN